MLRKYRALKIVKKNVSDALGQLKKALLVSALHVLEVRELYF